MIKGKTLIELTDVNTGKVERFEDENIITDAAQLYYDGMFLLGSSEKNKPIWDSVFGGVKLFENTIEENPSNFQMPSVAVNKVVGFASCDTSDGTDARRGSRNLQETVAIENGVQIVWDFATSEANGTISCVCLTSGYGGKVSYFNCLELLSDDTQNLHSRYYATSTGEYNYTLWDEYAEQLITSKSSPSMTVKYKLPVEDIAFNDYFNSQKQIGEVLDKSTNYIITNFKVHPDYYYFLNASSTASPTNLKIVKYDKLTLDKTEQILQIPLGGLNGTWASGFGTIIDGYIYLKKNANTVYKIDMSNTSNITEITFEGGALSDYLYELPNGDWTSGNVVFDHTTGAYEIVAEREKTFDGKKNSEAFLVRCYIVKGFKTESGYYSLALNDTMLHSINNLDTPVTKTADKTMKITYTLTYN